MNTNLCPICHADQQAYLEMMGEPCWHGHTTPRYQDEQYASIGISGKQYAYWMFLESKLVSSAALLEGLAPLDTVIVWRN